MNSIVLLSVVGVIAVVLIALVLIRRPSGRQSPHTKQSSGARVSPPREPVRRQRAEVVKPSNGKMLMPGPECCWGIRQLVDTWYSEGDVPELPLDSCDRIADCKCHYRQLPDRRVKSRRTQIDRRGDIRFETKSERRCGEDRRRGEDSWKISV